MLEPEQRPPGVAAMNSRVRSADVETGRESEIPLAFPRHAEAEQDRVSVLAPIGTALLGLSIGATLEGPVPDGRTRRVRVVAIPYPPEAVGHTHL